MHKLGSHQTAHTYDSEDLEKQRLRRKRGKRREEAIAFLLPSGQQEAVPSLDLLTAGVPSRKSHRTSLKTTWPVCREEIPCPTPTSVQSLT